MKKIAKGLVCCLAAVPVTSGLFGCSRGGTDIKINKEQTQLYVGNYDGGYGHVWLDHIIEEFEEKYKDVSFEEGKKGVQIIPENNKELTGGNLLTGMSSKTNEVYFTESADYYAFLEKGLLLDITDMMTEEQKDDGNKTIVSKMNDTQKAYYCTDGKYYAVPHYAGFSGLMYDINLFEEENLYFSGVTKGRFVTSDSEKRSAGPDGREGTSDDGLPATYDEFFLLLDHMVKEKNITPFVFTGQYATYLNWFVSSFYADYEGADNLKALLNLDGSTVDDIVELEGGEIGSPKSVALTEENGYKLFGTQGKLESLKILERILTNDTYYYNPCIGSTYSNRDAQTDFLRNGVTDTKKNRIAFLSEGIWWAEEAKDDFAYVAERKGDKYSKENRNIGILPVPKANEEKLGKNTLVDINKSTAFIWSGISPSKIELAKTFLAYACSDEALKDFTVTTGCPKALNYEMGDSFDLLSNYGKNFWNTYSSSDYVLHYSSNELYKRNLSELEMFKAGYSGEYGNQPFLRMCPKRAATDTLTAEDVFKQILTKHDASWWETFIYKK